MIPKLIHYCWLSDEEKPTVIKQCMKTWDILKENGFEFMLWDRTKFDVESTPYTKTCWDRKLYAFICDYIRIKALYEYGGIYLDSDVEIYKPFDDFVLDNDYFLTKGFADGINATTMASVKNHEIFKIIKEYYDENILPHPFNKTKTLVMENRMERILQDYNGLILHDSDYFNPQRNVSEKSYCNHLDMASWCEPLYHNKNKKWC
jgi:mannosyltransferase OCH1-like enzyme